MTDIEHVDYDQVTEQVRKNLAWRLEKGLESLTPYVNGAMGEVLPGHVQAFLAAVKLQGQLYTAFKPPRELETVLTASRVQRMLEEARTEAALLAVAEERRRVQEVRELEAAEAGVSVRAELERLRGAPVSGGQGIATS